MPGGSRKQLKPRAAALLAAGQRYTEVAAQLGVSEKTLRRWAGRPDFRALVGAVQGEALRQAAGVLADATTAAARAQVALLDSPDDRVRLAAARDVLAGAGRLREEYLLEERLAALEAQSGRVGGPT